MKNVIIFCDHLEYCTAIGIIYGHSLWSFGIFFRFWYVWTGKNLATLYPTDFESKESNEIYFLPPMSIKLSLECKFDIICCILTAAKKQN
jgi:hypothetical protein